MNLNLENLLLLISFFREEEKDAVVFLIMWCIVCHFVTNSDEFHSFRVDVDTPRTKVDSRSEERDSFRVKLRAKREDVDAFRVELRAKREDVDAFRVNVEVFRTV